MIVRLRFLKYSRLVCKMFSILSDLPLVIFLVIVNSISVTFFILFQFNIFHGIATGMSMVLSLSILYLQFIRKELKTQRRLKSKMMGFMSLGTAVGFIWFFFLIYKVVQFQGDIIDLMLNSINGVLALALSIHLIVVAHKTYLYAVSQTLEDSLKQARTDVPISFSIITQKSYQDNRNEDATVNPTYTLNQLKCQQQHAI